MSSYQMLGVSAVAPVRMPNLAVKKPDVYVRWVGVVVQKAGINKFDPEDLTTSDFKAMYIAVKKEQLRSDLTAEDKKTLHEIESLVGFQLKARGVDMSQQYIDSFQNTPESKPSSTASLVGMAVAGAVGTYLMFKG